ncbi:DUF2291 family protein [Maribacter sp. CXY002]|uniref:DUF2291 family protein n=1 Tax=Maribacter luteocoastalis TaxID=3407671 RepID=UPI003B671ECD
MGKLVKYSVLTIIVLMALYGSVTISPLDEIKQRQNDTDFNAKAYAEDFMNSKIQGLRAINATDFLQNISNDISGYCEKNGKRLGISDAYNFIVEGKGTVSSIEEEYVVLTLENGSGMYIATDFIFGNAIRDGSAMANIGDYQNTMDFNTISIELNTIVRETIVAPFKSRVKENDTISFKGAVTVAITDPRLNSLKVIPLSINFND